MDEKRVIEYVFETLLNKGFIEDNIVLSETSTPQKLVFEVADWESGNQYVIEVESARANVIVVGSTN
jgi:hypothetical protein